MDPGDHPYSAPADSDDRAAKPVKRSVGNAISTALFALFCAYISFALIAYNIAVVFNGLHLKWPLAMAMALSALISLRNAGRYFRR